MSNLPTNSIQKAQEEIQKLQNEITELESLETLKTFSEKWKVLCQSSFPDRDYMVELLNDTFPSNTGIKEVFECMCVCFGRYSISIPLNGNTTVNLSYSGRVITEVSESPEKEEEILKIRNILNAISSGNRKEISKVIWPKANPLSQFFLYWHRKIFNSYLLSESHWKKELDLTLIVRDIEYKRDLEFYNQFQKDKKAFKRIYKKISDVFKTGYLSLEVQNPDILP